MDGKNRMSSRLDIIDLYMQDYGYESQMIKKTLKLPIDLLISTIKNDIEGRERYMQFMHIPMETETGTKYIDLLQMYIKLPFDLNLECGIDTAAFITNINSSLPLGNFGIAEDNSVYFRYVLPVSKSKILDKDEFKEIVDIFIDMVDMFGEIIEEVANGSKDMYEAMDEMNGMEDDE